MNIGIVDADLMDNGTRHPNLALMKIAGYHIDNGDEVILIYDTYNNIRKFDKVYISCVFNFTKIPDWVIQEPNVQYGGTGFFVDGGPSLSDEIEHHMPHYNLYKEYVEEMINSGKDKKRYLDYINYSIGFTTRGCFRKCEFCVNKKYDRVQRHSSVNEFLDESRPMIYLWDDNILAYPKWEEVIEELETTKKAFQFRQGIDLRLMNNKKAYRLNHVKYHGDFIFAFDHLRDRDEIINKVQLWKKYTNKQPKMYVIAGFDSQDAEDIKDVFERISILMKYGSLPYIMRYEEYKNSRFKGMYTQIARWCNQPQFYKKMSFREFCDRNQYYHPNPNTLCASYKAMVDFEKEEPEIARKYFDLKLMNESIYNISYGVGHKYCNKQECSVCKREGLCWEKILNGRDNKLLLELYFNKEINTQCLRYSNSECNVNIVGVGKFLRESIIDASYEFIEATFGKNYEIEEILCRENAIVPLEKDYAYLKLLNELFKNNLEAEYSVKEIFEQYKADTDAKKQAIVSKLKILANLDFIICTRANLQGKLILSILGSEVICINKKDKIDIFKKNLYRLPIIQVAKKKGLEELEKQLKVLNILNIKNIVKFAKGVLI